MASGGGTSAWERILSQSATEPGALARRFPIDPDELERVISRYPMRVNPYYLGLIREVGDPIYRQCIPDGAEVEDERGLEDPLNEEGASPVPGLTHRYPDRVLFLVSGECAVYCRFCNRKRKVGRPSMVTPESIRLGLEYIRDHKEVRDVLLSGGDPLLLRDAELHGILAQVRAIPHVEIIRIGSRVPCTLPQRVTARLAGLLKAFHPLFISTHFNHPREVTTEAARACGRLADAGIPLGCQTVLLKGVNDDAGTIRELMLKLLRIRVRPYYLFQADLARGTAHFWTPLHLGLDITKRLQAQALGPGAPQFAVDLPGGGGKIPLQADTGQWAGEDRVPVKTRGRAVRGPSVHALGETTPCDEAVGREWT
jgi:lysine 2,3-aminomutase